MEALVGIPIKLSFVWVDVITRGISLRFPGSATLSKTSLWDLQP